MTELTEAHKRAIIAHALSPHYGGFVDSNWVWDRPKSILFRYDHEHYGDFLEFDSEEEAHAYYKLVSAYAHQVRDYLQKRRVDLIFEQVEAELKTNDTLA